MRKCVWEDSHTSQQLLNVALARIKRFLHVGTTDRLADSVTAAAVRGGGGHGRRGRLAWVGPQADWQAGRTTAVMRGGHFFLCDY